MKRLFVILIILLAIVSLGGCALKDSPLPAVQQKAVANCVEFISNSSFTSKEHMDTDIVKIENVTDNTWESVWSEEKYIDKNAIDLTDWIITIGDTSAHDFAIIVCDSDTCEVIGYIPID